MSDTFPEHTPTMRAGDRRARRTSNVTARELSRETAIILDEVIRDGRSFTVIRYGRPVAVLGPVRTNQEKSEPDVELRDLEKKLMELFRVRSPRAAFSAYLPETPSEIALGLTALTRAGLIAKTFTGSYALTARGRQYLNTHDPKGTPCPVIRPSDQAQ